jgi:hypothetical protein
MAVRRGGHVSGAAQHASNQGGAAQHAWDQGGVAQPTFAALPGDTSELNVAFYNVGIQISEVGKKNWKAKERKLVADIVKAANVDSLDILCLSELGAVDVGIGKNCKKAASLLGSRICSPTLRYRLSLSTPTDITRLSCFPVEWKSISTRSSKTSMTSVTGLSNTSVFARARAANSCPSSIATHQPRGPTEL